mmetsp:Transcript_537/g.1532  ORF Transcript_537/g.1532 Transcript_537/m.1532 type:complete len:230 (-) Transcript_537:38-727(-)
MRQGCAAHASSTASAGRPGRAPSARRAAAPAAARPAPRRRWTPTGRARASRRALPRGVDAPAMLQGLESRSRGRHPPASRSWSALNSRRRPSQRTARHWLLPPRRRRLPSGSAAQRRPRRRKRGGGPPRRSCQRRTQRQSVSRAGRAGEPPTCIQVPLLAPHAHVSPRHRGWHAASVCGARGAPRMLAASSLRLLPKAARPFFHRHSRPLRHDQRPSRPHPRLRTLIHR